MTASPTAQLRTLQQLASFYGIQSAYYDMKGERRQAAPENLLRVLQAMDAPLDRVEQAAEALRACRQLPPRRRVPPVMTAWQSRPAHLAYTAPPDRLSAPLHFELLQEDGGSRRGTWDLEALPTLRVESIEGARYPVKTLPLPTDLPVGYHELRLADPSFSSSTLILAAPLTAYASAEPADKRSWGVFLPLYALRSARDWGAGDLSDFQELIEWVASQGGRVTATLPLLASFLDEPFEPSPYAPASRLFWNEAILDATRAPELEQAPAARALIDSDETRQALRCLRERPLVDYRGVMALKSRVLRELARAFFSVGAPARREDFARFLENDPLAADYAAFRAAGCRQHASWHHWLQGGPREGSLSAADFDENDRQTYLYAQWLLQQQLAAVSEKARQSGPGLYLDLPLGVNADSYDVWRQRDLFALSMSGGAPPDAFFSKGQTWGFPPMLPQKMRETKYHYWRQCLDRLMRHAGVLRIDHVMGLHRLFWVPAGQDATQGFYVKYPAHELYAILNIESHRHRTVLVGEDLGTVPNYTRQALSHHRIHSMYVMQFNLTANPEHPIRPVSEGAVASLNTHDMPTFTGFWQGKDIDDQLALGLIKPHDEQPTRQWRGKLEEALIAYFRKKKSLPPLTASDPAIPPAVIHAAYQYLGASPAMMVLINLEDLWGEPCPQNVPGTSHERPNWQRKARLTLEAIKQSPEIAQLFKEMNALRAAEHRGTRTNTDEQQHKD